MLARVFIRRKSQAALKFLATRNEEGRIVSETSSGPSDSILSHLVSFDNLAFTGDTDIMWSGSRRDMNLMHNSSLAW